MSIKISSVGIIYESNNSKPLNNEITNIKIDPIKEFSENNVLLNDQNEYIFKSQSLNSYFFWPTLEEKYLFNQILKYYELSSNQYVQGFNSRYFSKLSELLSLKDINSKEYSKKRIELFNKRVKESHSSYINYFKKRGEEVILQSSMNKKLNPVNLSHTNKLRNGILKLKYKKRNQINKLINEPNKMIINNRYSRPNFSPDLSLLSFNQYRKSLSSFKLNNSSTAREESYNTVKTLKNKFLLNKSYSNFKIEEGKENSNLLTPRLYSNNKQDNDNKEEDINFKEKKAKEDFFGNYNKKRYMKFLKYKYQFIEDKNFEKKLPKITNKDIKRINIFKFKPKNKFISKEVKDGYKFIFFKKIKNKIDGFNNSNKSLKSLKKSFLKHNVY